jgi:hypothetical protein
VSEITISVPRAAARGTEGFSAFVSGRIHRALNDLNHRRFRRLSDLEIVRSRGLGTAEASALHASQSRADRASIIPTIVRALKCATEVDRNSGSGQRLG